MLVFPQLSNGALVQFPTQRRRRTRTLVNLAADGTTVKLADAGAASIEWQLKYAGLSDAELAALLQFFTAASGSLTPFTFVEPTGNLLAWSDDFSNAVWNADPMLSLAGNIADPAGGSNAWHIQNSGAAAQDLSQTLQAPGAYVYCLSVYAKSAVPGTFQLNLGSSRFVRSTGTSWQRFACAASGDAGASSMTFGIELPEGAAIDFYGLQVEPQDSPSGYKPGTTGGCYENARLRDDVLTFTTTDINRHSATVNIFYAHHL